MAKGVRRWGAQELSQWEEHSHLRCRPRRLWHLRGGRAGVWFPTFGSVRSRSLPEEGRGLREVLKSVSSEFRGHRRVSPENPSLLRAFIHPGRQSFLFPAGVIWSLFGTLGSLGYYYNFNKWLSMKRCLEWTRLRTRPAPSWGLAEEGWAGGEERGGEKSPVIPLPLQIAALLPVGVGCGERMGLLPPWAHNGQRRFCEVFALPALRAQSALLGKSSSPLHQQAGTAGLGFL